MCYRELFCAGWQLLERFKIEVKIQDLLCVTLILDMITWVKTTRNVKFSYSLHRNVCVCELVHTCACASVCVCVCVYAFACVHVSVYV